MSSDISEGLSDKNLSPKEQMLLKFMTATIGRINTCLINIHALQALMIRKGVFTQKELQAQVKDATNLPTVTLGKKVLVEMMQEFDVSKLASMIEMSPSEKSYLKQGYKKVYSLSDVEPTSK